MRCRFAIAWSDSWAEECGFLSAETDIFVWSRLCRLLWWCSAANASPPLLLVRLLLTSLKETTIRTMLSNLADSNRSKLFTFIPCKVQLKCCPWHSTVMLSELLDISWRDRLLGYGIEFSSNFAGIFDGLPGIFELSASPCLVEKWRHHIDAPTLIIKFSLVGM